MNKYLVILSVVNFLLSMFFLQLIIVCGSSHFHLGAELEIGNSPVDVLRPFLPSPFYLEIMKKIIKTLLIHLLAIFFFLPKMFRGTYKTLQTQFQQDERSYILYGHVEKLLSTIFSDIRRAHSILFCFDFCSLRLINLQSRIEVRSKKILKTCYMIPMFLLTDFYLSLPLPQVCQFLFLSKHFVKNEFSDPGILIFCVNITFELILTFLPPYRPTSFQVRMNTISKLSSLISNTICMVFQV